MRKHVKITFGEQTEHPIYGVLSLTLNANEFSGKFTIVSYPILYFVLENFRMSESEIKIHFKRSHYYLYFSSE